MFELGKNKSLINWLSDKAAEICLFKVLTRDINNNKHGFLFVNLKKIIITDIQTWKFCYVGYFDILKMPNNLQYWIHTSTIPAVPTYIIMIILPLLLSGT